jgi:hypothetical protein
MIEPLKQHLLHHLKLLHLQKRLTNVQADAKGTTGSFFNSFCTAREQVAASVALWKMQRLPSP